MRLHLVKAVFSAVSAFIAPPRPMTTVACTGCRNDVDYFQQRSRGGRRRMEETISITAVGAMAADAVIERYRIRQTTDAMEWNELFARVTHPNLYQSWAFGEAKRL